MLRPSTFKSASRAVLPAITKGVVTAVDGLKVTVELADAGSKILVSALMHPKGSSFPVPVGSTTFVSRPYCSNNMIDAYEVIAVGMKSPSDGKVQMRKFSCIHPERPVETLEKLCPNCPRRTV